MSVARTLDDDWPFAVWHWMLRAPRPLICWALLRVLARLIILLQHPCWYKTQRKDLCLDCCGSKGELLDAAHTPPAHSTEICFVARSTPLTRFWAQARSIWAKGDIKIRKSIVVQESTVAVALQRSPRDARIMVTLSLVMVKSLCQRQILTAHLALGCWRSPRAQVFHSCQDPARDYWNCNVSSNQRDAGTSVCPLPSGSGVPSSCQRRSTTGTSVSQWSYSGMCWKVSAGNDSRNSVHSPSSGGTYESSSKSTS